MSFSAAIASSSMSATFPHALEALIINTCAAHKAAHWKDTDYRACISIDSTYFVKFDHPRALWPEIETQKYIYEYAQSHPAGAPRVAKVIHHFINGDGLRTMYLVMEYIHLKMDAPPGRTVEALRWLMGVPAPPGHVLGPLGGGIIRHRFFKDNKAPLLFSSIGALERYMAKARTLLSTKTAESLVLSDERLLFMQSDMHPSNFGVDEDGNTVLMDFAEIGMLPECFAAYTLFFKNAAMATSLGLAHSSKLKSMALVSHCLWIVHTPKLDLNEDGYPVDKN